jgi:hypothetical protein
MQNYKQIDEKSKEQKKEEKKLPPPHHELPPHILKELFDLREKVGKLEGQMDVLLRLKSK